jgi:hypothetical protein
MTEDAPWPHPAALDINTLSKQCVFTKGRMSGPGGQHRNKVETAVFITHTPTGIEAHAGERRESTVNRSVAITRLRLALAVELRTPVPIGPIGSALWRSRLVAKRDAEGHTTTRIACSPTHHDYPALLAEVLDVIADAGWDHSTAALRLDTTPSQVLKFVKDHPPAYARLNQEREKRKMPKLK